MQISVCGDTGLGQTIFFGFIILHWILAPTPDQYDVENLLNSWQ